MPGIWGTQTGGKWVRAPVLDGGSAEQGWLWGVQSKSCSGGGMGLSETQRSFNSGNAKKRGGRVIGPQTLAEKKLGGLGKRGTSRYVVGQNTVTGSFKTWGVFHGDRGTV